MTCQEGEGCVAVLLKISLLSFNFVCALVAVFALVGGLGCQI